VRPVPLDLTTRLPPRRPVLSLGAVGGVIVRRGAGVTRRRPIRDTAGLVSREVRSACPQGTLPCTEIRLPTRSSPIDGAARASCCPGSCVVSDFLLVVVCSFWLLR
jgi:hypothetical protein